MGNAKFFGLAKIEANLSRLLTMPLPPGEPIPSAPLVFA